MNFVTRSPRTSRQLDSRTPSPDCGGMLRAIGRERTSLLSRKKARMARGFMRASTIRKAIRATRRTGTTGRANLLAATCSMRNGSASRRLCWNSPEGRTIVPQKIFNARQLEEKAEEVRICLYVAREMNRRDATDYYAKDPVYYLENRNEPIDVELFSKSDAYPPYRIQVVTAPSNKHLELRSHIKNVESLRNRLATAFAE